MKRIYIRPEAEVFVIEPNAVICGSREYSTTPIGPETDEYLAPVERGVCWSDYEGQ